jgi:hypothetical protein
MNTSRNPEIAAGDAPPILRLKAVFAVVIGNCWIYDFLVYTFFAVMIGDAA